MYGTGICVPAARPSCADRRCAPRAAHSLISALLCEPRHGAGRVPARLLLRHAWCAPCCCRRRWRTTSQCAAIFQCVPTPRLCDARRGRGMGTADTLAAGDGRTASANALRFWSCKAFSILPIVPSTFCCIEFMIEFCAMSTLRLCCGLNLCSLCRAPPTLARVSRPRVEL